MANIKHKHSRTYEYKLDSVKKKKMYYYYTLKNALINDYY